MPDTFEALPDTGQPQTFERVSRGVSPMLQFWGGLGMVVLAVVSFVIAIRLGLSQVTIHMTSTVPLGFGLITAFHAWGRRRPITSVTVDMDGVWVTTAGTQHVYVWQDIGWCRVDQVGVKGDEALFLYGPAGKVIQKLPNDLDRFDELCVLVQGLADQQADTSGNTARRRVLRRQALFFWGGALVVLCVSSGLAWMTWVAQDEEAQLRAHGVSGTAEVVRLFTAPDGRTRRMEYRVVTDNATGPVENVEVDPGVWQALQGRSEVAVVYVPADFGMSQLASGQIDSVTMSGPKTTYAMCAVAACIAIGLIVVGVLNWRGSEIGSGVKKQTR